ncbi:hypothetical protein GIB67_034914 [Kingdonia uniflora]|uniref:RIN4 pathogenic type III effector avirulence factor Avr cleavage site domain-containing protein n=1 Tax=Kingdonia uniflora TaxID=39325 RepID=A0A7J7LA95_9MAGN|nr:hypothetical protein GIB67_028287 [Kingdonia uniflora]KAF6166363.1 hypothetical protein GIB67_034914 [Kingdonia uniflora]
MSYISEIIEILFFLLQQRSHVPKFGNWESEDNVPYTVYFDKARKGKTGGKMINPNDPQDNPDEFPDDTPPVRAPPLITGTELELPVGQETARPRHERASSREDGDLRRLTDSPVRHDNVGRRGRGVNSGEAPKRGGRLSGGSDRSIEHSPLHPQHQARAGGRGTVISSPSWEKKSSEGSHTPGRSRLRTVGRGDESDKSISTL